MLAQIEEVKRAIWSLPFVSKLSPVGGRNSHGDGCQVSLRYPDCEEYGSCGKKQKPPAEKERDAAQSDVHEVITEVENWDLRDHRQEATRVQNRRNVQLGSRQNQVKPRGGTDDFFQTT
jgi:hypothetical protein